MQQEQQVRDKIIKDLETSIIQNLQKSILPGLANKIDIIIKQKQQQEDFIPLDQFGSHINSSSSSLNPFVPVPKFKNNTRYFNTDESINKFVGEAKEKINPIKKREREREDYQKSESRMGRDNREKYQKKESNTYKKNNKNRISVLHQFCGYNDCDCYYHGKSEDDIVIKQPNRISKYKLYVTNLPSNESYMGLRDDLINICYRFGIQTENVFVGNDRDKFCGIIKFYRHSDAVKIFWELKKIYFAGKQLKVNFYSEY